MAFEEHPSGHPVQKSDLVDITVQIFHETEKAYLVSDDGKRKIWLPKSWCQVEDNGNRTYTLTIKEDKAKEKGLI